MSEATRPFVQTLLHLRIRTACASEIVCALGLGAWGEDLGDGVGDGVEGSRGGFSQERFELGERLLDQIEVGRAFRVYQPSHDFEDRLKNLFVLLVL